MPRRQDRDCYRRKPWNWLCDCKSVGRTRRWGDDCGKGRYCSEFAVGGSVNAGLLSLTKSLAELGVQDQVQVNAVNPGAVRTDRLNVRLQALVRDHHVSLEEAAQKMVHNARTMRLGLPEDVAYLVAFLVSAHGRFVHGALIDIDGGETKTI